MQGTLMIDAKTKIETLAAYIEFWRCSEASLARTAKVDPADLSNWKKGAMSTGRSTRV